MNHNYEWNCFQRALKRRMASRMMRPSRIRYQQKCDCIGAHRRDARAVCFARRLRTIGTTASCKKISRNFGHRSICCCRLPREFGGAGMTLAEICREQRPVGISRARNCAGSEYARLLDWGRGRSLAAWDTSLEWLLREAAAGEIFAAGHAESGNDVPVLLSTSKAERVEGGYKFTGRKLSAA